MLSRRIDDVVRQTLGTFNDAGIPGPVEGKRWLRLPCPFCGGDRAVISYEVGYFECWHKDCRVRLSATGDISDVRRFWLQIEQAARNLAGKFPHLFGNESAFREAQNYAAERVVVYAGSPTEGDSDAGQLAEWEDQVKSDPDQLDRFVLQALNSDLLDYAKARLRQNRRELPLAPESIKASGYVSGGNLDAYPVLHMRYAEGKTREQIARELGVPLARVKRMISAETKRYREENRLAA
jgi:hypothetical protein